MKYSDLTDGIETDLMGIHRKELYDAQEAVKSAEEDMEDLSGSVAENKEKILRLVEATSKLKRVKEKILASKPKA